jgi:two-component system chemotaxis sensor kinase CheA
VRYRQIGEGGADGQVLVVMTDVTSELAFARAEVEQRELAAVFERFGRDRASVLGAFDEGRALVGRLGAVTGGDLARDLHTIKGSTALLGLDGLASLAHALEDELAAEGALSEAACARLREAWDDVERRFDFLLRAGNRLEVEHTELEGVLRALAGAVPRADVARMLETWRGERVGHRLDQLAQQARRIAERLDKLPVEVEVQGAELRLAPGALSEFWGAFVHVVRNAVDHGLQTPAERAAAGKPAAARLVLRAALQGEAFLLEVEDEGRGVDWDAARASARATGGRAETSEDLVDALCADGFTTAAAVSEISGRGIGLGAARAACVRAGGTFELRSERGRGTLVRFRFPAGRVGASAPDAGRPRPTPGRPASVHAQ